MTERTVEIITLPVADEWPHPPGPEPLWQESVVLTWQDIDHGVGGFFRIGHHPNRGLGVCTFGVVARDGPWFARSRLHIPVSPEDRFADGFSIDGFLTARFADGFSRWTARDEDCEVDLHVTDRHPLYDAWALAGLKGAFRDKFASQHTEVAGTVTGTVRIGDRFWTINGYGFRDHSWGVRNHDDPATALTNLVWFVGSFGDDLVVSACEAITRSGGRFSTGFVICDGRIERPTIRDLSVEVNLDGISTRGARCQIETQRLGRLDLVVEGFGNVVMGMECEPGREQEYLEIGMPGRMRCGGRVGGAHISTMFNARAGTSAPAVLFGATFAQGVSQPPRWYPS